MEQEQGKELPISLRIAYDKLVLNPLHFVRNKTGKIKVVGKGRRIRLWPIPILSPILDSLLKFATVSILWEEKRTAPFFLA